MLAHVAGEIKKFIDSEAGNGRLKAERALLSTALEDVQAMAAVLTGHLMGAQEQPTELYKVGLGSVRFLMSVGDLLIGWQLLRQSEIAIKALDEGASDKDKPFYEGKLRRRRSSSRTSCPSSPRRAPSSRTSTTTSWRWTRPPSSPGHPRHVRGFDRTPMPHNVFVVRHRRFRGRSGLTTVIVRSRL